MATYDDQDRILTYNGRQYISNSSGDVVGIQEPVLSRPHSYSYGPLGKMKSYVQANGTQGELLENAAGQTVRWTRNGSSLRYGMYEGARLIGIFDEVARTSQHYVHGEHILTPSYMAYKGRTYRFITDHLGSPRLIVDTENGKILQEIEYDVWGKVIRDTNVGVQPFSFAGGILNHDTGFVRFGARDYDPEVGRWTSKDPILFAGGDANLFGYVSNEPVNWMDPFGLAKCTYSISTGRLTCISNDGSATGSANMFSGNNDSGSTGYNGGPIPIGKYDITKLSGANERDWFLDPGLLLRVGYRLNLNRGGFKLHLRKGGSDGCITGAYDENDGSFEKINRMLNRDVGSNTLEVGF